VLGDRRVSRARVAGRPARPRHHAHAWPARVVCTSPVVCKHRHPTPAIPRHMSWSLGPPWQPMYMKSLSVPFTIGFCYYHRDFPYILEEKAHV
jgi:hypothetical protein